jgi:hypothetical protein
VAVRCERKSRWSLSQGGVWNICSSAHSLHGPCAMMTFTLEWNLHPLIFTLAWNIHCLIVRPSGPRKRKCTVCCQRFRSFRCPRLQLRLRFHPWNYCLGTSLNEDHKNTLLCHLGVHEQILDCIPNTNVPLRLCPGPCTYDFCEHTSITVFAVPFPTLLWRHFALEARLAHQER